jgi:F-type H+-transporting ATPase subunit delta
MSRPTTAARRYAEAAFQLATRDDALDSWADGLALAARFAADEELLHVVDNPSIPHAERRATTDKLLEGRVSSGVLNLVRLLTLQGRFGSLPQIAAEFSRLVNRRNNVVEAVVTSAAPLTAGESDAIGARVRAMTGSGVTLRTEVDPGLIGGLTVRIGDQLLDASVRGRLERLRDELVTSPR